MVVRYFALLRCPVAGLPTFKTARLFTMRFFELLRAAFNHPKKSPPAPVVEHTHSTEDASVSEPAPANDERRIHITTTQKIDLLIKRYGPEFTAFLYRPHTAQFIREEVLLFINPPSQYNGFLDNSHWSEKHYLNFPGPFYTGDSDTCGTGDQEAPDNVLYDGPHVQEYIFRQPQSFAEFLCVLDAAAVEVLDSYSCDGNDHWTYLLCQEWWRGKAEIIRRLNTPAFRETNGNRVQLYIDYLDGAAETDLRKYCYFLENGRYPTATEPLPSL